MSPLLSEISERSVPAAGRHLLEQYHLIEPADDKLSSDMGLSWLHLNHLGQNFKTVAGDLLTSEPVESGLFRMSRSGSGGNHG